MLYKGAHVKTTKAIGESMTNSHGGLQNFGGSVFSINVAVTAVKWKSGFGSMQTLPCTTYSQFDAANRPGPVFYGTLLFAFGSADVYCMFRRVKGLVHGIGICVCEVPPFGLQGLETAI